MAAPVQPERLLRDRKDEEASGSMSFFDHLVELRKRIVSSLGAIGIGVIVGFFVARRFITFISQPMVDALKANHSDPSLYFTNPAGYVSLVITLSVYLGIAIAMPWVLYQVWLFVAPGLYKHERKAVASFIASAMFLFVCGIVFGYSVMLPRVLTYIVGFANEGPIKPLINVNEYFELIVVVLLGLGVIFEMPVVVFILSVFGIVTPKFLLKNFRYAMLLITVAAAIVTPTPDATTMIVFMAPMVLLYFLSVLVAYLVVRKKRKKEQTEAGA